VAAASENFGKAHLIAAGGVVAPTETWLVSDHPAAPLQGGFAAFPHPSSI